MLNCGNHRSWILICTSLNLHITGVTNHRFKQNNIAFLLHLLNPLWPLIEGINSIYIFLNPIIPAKFKSPTDDQIMKTLMIDDVI